MLRKHIALEDGFPADKSVSATQALEDALKIFENNHEVIEHWENKVKPNPDYTLAANEYVCRNFFHPFSILTYAFQVQGAISGIRGDIKTKAQLLFSGYYKLSAHRNMEQKEKEIKWLLSGQPAKFTYGGELNLKVYSILRSVNGYWVML